jgi:hypothetical protein
MSTGTYPPGTELCWSDKDEQPVFFKTCPHSGVHVTRDDQTYMGFKRPDLFGKYGVYGGKYVPETLMAALTHLEVAYRATIRDPDFQVETIFLL